uniref:MAPK regulated corepressor interacting protein 2 n=1 Tax=Phasianus colchicus TaxID=9054 RepID=A0A669PNB2_PHACC
TSVPQESYTAAHEENVRFIYEAWQEVEQQLDGGQRGESARGPVQYVEKTPDPKLKDFVPIDLEDWWAQRFLTVFFTVFFFFPFLKNKTKKTDKKKTKPNKKRTITNHKAKSLRSDATLSGI